MIWYGLHTYPALASNEPTLLLAQANLLKKHNRPITPPELIAQLDGQDVTYASLTDYDPELVLTTVGGYNTWPDTADAIVAFRIIDEKGQATDHYCLLADPINFTVVDSADGQVKSPGIYGKPTGWASYSVVPLEDQELAAAEPVVTESVPEPVKNPKEYTLLRDESIWTIARRLHIPVQELIEHNGIADPFSVGQGSVIRLPEVAAVEEVYQPIRYEYLNPAQPMHVARAGGAKKWYFGHVKTLKDLEGKGAYAEGYNVEAVAIAHLTIGDDEAAFYMDAVAFGDKLTTGRVNYTMGFACQDMALGFAEKATSKPEPVAERKIVEQAFTAPVVAPEPQPEPIAPNLFKTTYRGFSQPQPYVVVGDQSVNDLDNKRPPIAVRDASVVIIAGTFCKDHVFYGRPEAAVRGGSWYGIQMDLMDDYHELHTAPLAPADQLAIHKKNRTLTLADRRWQLISKLSADYQRFKHRKQNV